MRGGKSCSSRMDDALVTWRAWRGWRQDSSFLLCLPLRVHGSFWLGVELARALGLAPSFIQWLGGCATERSRQGTVKSISLAVEAAAGSMVTSESRSCSSSWIWYRMDILPSSSEIFWVRWRRLSHPDGEVSGGIFLPGPVVLAVEKQSWPVKGNCNRGKNSCLIEVSMQQAESTGRDLLTRAPQWEPTAEKESCYDAYRGPTGIQDLPTQAQIMGLCLALGYFSDCRAGTAGGVRVRLRCC